MQSLKLADDFFPSVLDGRKTSTIRMGVLDIHFGALLLEGARDRFRQALVEVDRIEYHKFRNLDERLLAAEGLRTMAELRAMLKCFYPSVTPDSPMTVLSFSVMRFDDEGDFMPVAASKLPSAETIWSRAREAVVGRIPRFGRRPANALAAPANRIAPQT